MITIPAFAKINLSLEILGRREDGYHDLVSIMQTISLADSLTLRASRKLTFTCSNSSLATANLVEKAAVLLRERYDVSPGCAIHLQKEIPVAAGLGGGSSDAAAALLGLNQFWNLGLTCDDLLAIALELGSDVPFFLWGGTCLVEGRGERITPLAAPEPTWYLLANPRVRVSTGEVFASLNESNLTNGEQTRELLRGWPKDAFGKNGLQDVLFCLCPEASQCFSVLGAVSPEGAMVSGSGPTVFAPFRSPRAAEHAAGLADLSSFWTAVVSDHYERTVLSPCA